MKSLLISLIVRYQFSRMSPNVLGYNILCFNATYSNAYYQYTDSCSCITFILRVIFFLQTSINELLFNLSIIPSATSVVVFAFLPYIQSFWLTNMALHHLGRRHYSLGHRSDWNVLYRRVLWENRITDGIDPENLLEGERRSESSAGDDRLDCCSWQCVKFPILAPQDEVRSK